jgi:hypothetical protein
MVELAGTILLIILVGLHYKKTENEGIKSYYLPALCLKVLAGIGVGLVYKYYYSGGDTWNYFHQAQLVGSMAFSNWDNFVDLFFYNKYDLIEGFIYVNQPRAALMIKVVAIINVFSNCNYWITSAYFSFFSFVGVWAFASWVAKSFSYGKVAAIALFVWPSFVFWSSGVLKESVAIGLIFLIIPAYFRMLQVISIRKGLALVFGIYFLFLIKYYLAVVLLVVLLVHTIIDLINFYNKSYFKQFIAWVLLMASGLIIGGYLHPNLAFQNVLEVIIGNNQAYVALSNSTSLIYFVNASSAVGWLVLNAPKALLASLFMPLNITTTSIAYTVSAIENWLLLILFFRGAILLNYRNLKPKFNLLMASLFYIVLLAVFLALSTPNLGTLSRYKVAFIPIFLTLILVANKINIKNLLGR